ncbi:MAG: sulfurtransferase [Chloroflexi bacterium]|nr:sulfurtransferase [Chloroflexota bacterium]
MAEVKFLNPHLLVETEWLSLRLYDPDVRVVDLRTPREYDKGHIPNSVNLPVDRLNTPDNPRMVLPQEQMETLMGELGIGNETAVVAVDEMGGSTAARLLWTLELYGHARACLLNGGHLKWTKTGGELSVVAPGISPARFTSAPDFARLATKDQVLEKLGRPGVVIVDARNELEYAGMLGDAARLGHIPGAVNINWEEHLSLDAVPVFLPPGELQSLYETVGVTRDKEVIAYCERGRRASHTYLALRLLGYQRVRNYFGSWQEWGNDPETPIEGERK